MKWAILFWAFAVLFAWAGEGVRNDSLAGSVLFFLLVSASLAEAFTGLLYFGASWFKVNPARIFKWPDGRIIFLSRLFIWPYQLFEFLASFLYRWRGRELTWEVAREGLLIGARVKNSDLPALERESVSAVLDLVAEFSEPERLRANTSITYLCLPVLDGSAPSLHELTKAVHFVTGALGRGQRVLVHCTFGHGRSATVVAATLLELGEAEDPASALSLLASRLKRPIRLSPEQRSRLAEFSRQRTSAPSSA